MKGLSLMQIGDAFAGAVKLKSKPVCVYGSDRIPESGIRSSLLSQCLASTIYQIANCTVNGPVFAGFEPDQAFCRCIGGPAWFGYEKFDPRLAALMSAGPTDTNCTPKYLKENKNVANDTYESVGEINPLGKYVVMRRCEDMQEDPGVKCIICFGTGEQIRDLCALAHFRSCYAFNVISFPWGPTCATLVTYPAGMARNASLSRIYVGPTDPSAREWLPEDYMAIGIPSQIAKRMAEDIFNSFLAKKDKNFMV